MNGYIKQSACFAMTLLGWSLMALPAHAASFDCGKAQTKVEHLICDNPGLSALDDGLASRYKAALQNKTEVEDVRHAQKHWLKERNKCEDVSCLDALYLRRINDLDITIGQTKSAPSDVASEEYALVVSKNDEMCNHMLQLMNDDLKQSERTQFVRTYDSNDRFVSSHEEFNAIPWKPARASYENSGRTFYTENLEGALFDLNNDGVLDFVVRDKSMLSGMRADGIYIFDRSVANKANALTTKELFESKNQIHIAGDGYPLSPPLGGVGLMWLLSPFIYHDTSYIYMQSLYKKDEAIGGDFVVIAKYTGGKFAMREMTGKMEDICYIERVDVK